MERENCHPRSKVSGVNDMQSVLQVACLLSFDNATFSYCWVAHFPRNFWEKDALESKTPDAACQLSVKPFAKEASEQEEEERDSASPTQAILVYKPNSPGELIAPSSLQQGIGWRRPSSGYW